MDPIEKVLWFIESQIDVPVSLDAMAQNAGLSRYYLSRAFSAATGLSLSSYARGRRLSEAAKRLAEGAPDILGIAFDAGYGSHEAFTRAFRDQFGLTPELVRAQGHADCLNLVEPLKMKSQKEIDLAPPRLIKRRALTIAGVGDYFRFDELHKISALWSCFREAADHIPGTTGDFYYGVCSDASENGLDYIAGIEVEDLSLLPPDLARIQVPAQTYAVFEHHGHVAGISETWQSIWSHGIADSGYQAVRGPELEVMPLDYNPYAEDSRLEIWIAVKA